MQINWSKIAQLYVRCLGNTISLLKMDKSKEHIFLHLFEFNETVIFSFPLNLFIDPRPNVDFLLLHLPSMSNLILQLHLMGCAICHTLLICQGQNCDPIINFPRRQCCAKYHLNLFLKVNWDTLQYWQKKGPYASRLALVASAAFLKATLSLLLFTTKQTKSVVQYC